MALTDLQRKQIKDGVNKINVNTLIKYIQSGDLSLDELTSYGLNAERHDYIDNFLKTQPNMAEQKEWNEISAMLSSGLVSQDVLNILNAYVSRWESARPEGNHVDEAKQHIARVNTELEAQTAKLEQSDWEAVSAFSQTDLLGHLAKYPNTTHRNEIDEAVWGLVEKEEVADVENYLNFFPQGIHRAEAKMVLDAIYEWDQVKNARDIFIVNEYICKNANSPFVGKAKTLLAGLKQQEFREMREAPTSYEVTRLQRLLDERIISENDLLAAKVVTSNVLQTLLNTDVQNDLPDVLTAIETSRAECKPGYTDVFFFGIPATGKTCVLMGLSRSSSLNINLASGGGDYASALQQYTDVGLTVPPTPGSFVSTLEATISSTKNPDQVHEVNLVEMSGEEFAFAIANNQEHIFTFEDMGSGATALLSNNNRKVFFLIIDPTANVARIKRQVRVGFDEETGQELTQLQLCVVNQRAAINKMVNIFQDPGNAEIMKKVDSIHIIITKSDTLGNTVEREAKVQEIFNTRYAGDILEPLVKLGKEYSINTATNFRPKLYSFSLGSFYVGGLYEYDPTDSDRLVKAIRNSSQGKKDKTWWDRLKEIVN